VAPEDVKINPEAYLGIPGSFADIKVQVPRSPPYFVEVKYGYPSDLIIARLARKYGTSGPRFEGASKVILVADTQRHENWPEIQHQLESGMADGLKLEVWDEEHLLSLIHKRFGLKIDSISEENTVELRAVIDRAKGQHAFGEERVDAHLQSSLLWHFGFWRLQQLRGKYNLTSRFIIPPGVYRGVVVLMADLSSFAILLTGLGETF